MKKIILVAAIAFAAVSAQAQYGSLNAVLEKLEAQRMTTKNLGKISVDDKKFVLIKDFEDHTERDFIVVKGNTATYVEMFDDKKDGKSSSNVFTGDVVRTADNVLSFRFDRLENEKIAMPVTKTLLMARQKNILYLLDVNTKDRWIDEAAVMKK